MEDEGFIPLPNVSGKILKKVLECSEYYVKNPGVTTGATNSPSNEGYFHNETESELIELVLAANYLDNKPLLTVTSKALKTRFKDKTQEEITKIYNDYSILQLLLK